MTDVDVMEERMAPFSVAPCECVRDHSPNAMVTERHHIVPRSWGGPDTKDNIIPLCGTSHDNVHHLLNAYVRAGGEPGWEIRSAYSPFIRRLAERAWEARPAKPTFTVSRVD